MSWEQFHARVSALMDSGRTMQEAIAEVAKQQAAAERANP